MPKHEPMTIGPWPGGVNLQDLAGTLDANELSVCKNYRLDIKGYPYKRPGFDFYGNAPAAINGNNFVNFLDRYYKAGGSKFLLAAANGKLYTINDTTGVATQVVIDASGANLMHATNLYWKLVYKDREYILDGTKPVRFNGADSPYAGYYSHPAPTTSTTATGGGVGAGTYKYAIASVAGDMGEGPIGAVATQVTAANDTVHLTAMADAPARFEATAKRIYRTKVNGTSYFFLAEIANGVTIYDDTVADSALGPAYIPVHIPKADARYAILGYDDRIYWFGMGGVSASLVEVSDIGWPDRILDNEFFTVANNDGDILMGGAKSPSGLLFFKRNSTWLSRGFGTAPVNISPKVGTVSPLSIVTVPGGVIFLSTRGEIYFYDGVNLTEIGRKVKPEFIEMSSSALARVVAVYHDFRYIISYDPKGSKGFNYQTLEYDLISGKWDGPHDNAEIMTPSYYAAFDSDKDKNELMWGEAKATLGSFVYIRRANQFLDKTTKPTSIYITGSNFSEASGDVIVSKAFIEGRFSSDTILDISFILDDETTEVKGRAIQFGGATPPRFGIDRFGIAKFGSIFSQVGDTTIGIKARAAKPKIKVTDGGSSTSHQIDKMYLLGTALPLR